MSNVRRTVVPIDAKAAHAMAFPSSMRPAYAVGDVIDGRYVLRRELGRGAAGRVFEARHLFTNRQVAIKIVSPEASYSIIGELHARLAREARTLAAVRHPGIVDVLDGGTTPEGAPYIVLEMLRGRTLSGLLAARGRLSIEDTLGVALQLCDALTTAHGAGIVHRDLKPANILAVRELGREMIKLIDFGVAKFHESGQGKLTGVGAVIGTPEYMAPEQLRAAEDIDERADIYAVGITMYECLSGHCPYNGTYPQLLLQSATHRTARPLIECRPEAGAALSEVIHRAISDERIDRYRTVIELRQALEAAVPHARPETALLGPWPLIPSSTRPAPMVSAHPPAEQRRRTPRAPYATPVRILLANGTLDGRNEDISEGGMLLVSRDACEPGQQVNVRFALPIEGHVVACAAIVRWVRASRPGEHTSLNAIGLEFVELPQQVRTSIARYVALMGDPKQV